MMIAIEGVSCSGKSSLCQTLEASLQSRGYSVANTNHILVNDPTLQTIKEITHSPLSLLDPIEELFLYCSRLHRKSMAIEKLRSNSDIVLVDRFSLSVFVYHHLVRKLNAEFVKETIAYAANFTIPDLTILIQIPREIQAINRRHRNREQSRKDKFIELDHNTYSAGFQEHLRAFTRYQLAINWNESIESTTSKVISIKENL